MVVAVLVWFKAELIAAITASSPGYTYPSAKVDCFNRRK
jgi:hypothetical protein